MRSRKGFRVQSLTARRSANALKRPIWLESGLILLLALVCCRAPRAVEFSYTPPNLVESGASATATGHRAESGPEKGQQDRTLSSIALLTSSRPKHSEDLPLKSPPIDLGSAEVLARDLSAKWADLQSRIRSEEVIIAAFRSSLRLE
jgi:hypothetical protein